MIPVKPLRIGCVPYLNARPVIEWFKSPDCHIATDITYAVPSKLAVLLRNGELDAALVSTVELFMSPGLVVIPGISISADGPVRSVRLFSKVPPSNIKSLALDAGSLTSVALVRILLTERYGVQPDLERADPIISRMLADHDAALVIGDLRDPDPMPSYVLDLGLEWKLLTGLPFCYAAWLAHEDGPLLELQLALQQARDWGINRLGEIAAVWSQRLSIPAELSKLYLKHTIQYDLSNSAWSAVKIFQDKCVSLGMAPDGVSLHRFGLENSR